MKESNSWLTPKEAAKMAGCTARSITNMISDGRLSASKEDGRFYIEKSELFRVFPNAFRKEKEKEGILSEKIAESDRLKTENEMLRQMGTQMGREIEFLRDQLSSSTVEKSKMLEAIVATTRLIEHKKSSE